MEEDDEEMTPSELLLQGARYGDLDDIEAALKEGASAACADENGRTGLHMAAANGHVEAVRLLLQRHAAVDAVNSEGNSALHWAALNGHIAVVEHLLECGANPALLNKHERTPVDEALDSNHQAVVHAINRAMEGRVETADGGKSALSSLQNEGDDEDA